MPQTQSSEKGLASQGAQENEAPLPGPEIVWFIYLFLFKVYLLFILLLFYLVLAALGLSCGMWESFIVARASL